MHNGAGGKEASKGKDYPFCVSTVMGKGKEKAKDHPVSEGDSNRPKLLRDLAKEGKDTTEADQEVEKQERYKE